MYICVPFLGYPWSTRAILQANDPNLDVQRCALDSRPSLSLGLLGMPGLTSYFCMLNDGNPKENERNCRSQPVGLQRKSQKMSLDSTPVWSTNCQEIHWKIKEIQGHWPLDFTWKRKI